MGKGHYTLGTVVQKIFHWTWKKELKEKFAFHRNWFIKMLNIAIFLLHDTVMWHKKFMSGLGNVSGKCQTQIVGSDIVTGCFVRFSHVITGCVIKGMSEICISENNKRSDFSNMPF